MLYVFNTEGENEILGEFGHYDEDAVIYRRGDGVIRSAPADCVTVREVTRAEIISVLDNFVRQIDSAKGWIVDGGYGDTGLNTLVGIGVEMIEYAQVMGAALSSEAAFTDLRRQVRDEKRYKGERAHSRQFEEVPA